MKACCNTPLTTPFPTHPSAPEISQTQEMLKNEDRSDYVYENTWNGDKLPCQYAEFWTKMRRICSFCDQSGGNDVSITHHQSPITNFR